MKSNLIDKALKLLDIQENFIIIHSNLLAFFKKDSFIADDKR